MNDRPSSLDLQRSADVPTPPSSITTAQKNLKSTVEVPEQHPKRALYSITDKIRILKRMKEYSSRHPTHNIPKLLRGLNLAHIGYANAKLWLETSDEIFAADRLGYGSRYRLSLEERLQVKEELLVRDTSQLVGEAALSSTAAAASSPLAAATVDDAGLKEKNENIQQRVSYKVGPDCGTDIYSLDEEELLGVIIYRSSLTAKARREAKSRKI